MNGRGDEVIDLARTNLFRWGNTFRSPPHCPRITLGIHQLFLQTERIEKGRIQALQDGQQSIW